MKAIKDFLTGSVPADMKDGFEATLAQDLIRTSSILAPLLILFELLNMFSLLFLREGGLATFSRKVYFSMYILLILVLTTLLLVARRTFRRPPSPRNNRLLLRYGVGCAAFLVLWCLAITLYDQRVSENIGVYISGILPLAIFLTFKPWQALAIFGGGQILFLLLLPTFQPQLTDNAGSYTNASIIAILAISVAINQYRSKAAAYCNQVIITRQSEEICSINKLLHQQVYIDDLTRLFNRRYLQEILPNRWREARERQTEVGVLMLDIDDFKRYNDACGHQAGDACLRAITKRIRHDTSPERDYAIRYGGEEFLVLLFGRTAAETLQIAERIRADVSSLQIRRQEPPGHVTISIGAYAGKISATSHMDTFISYADSALYASKASGKNCVTNYST